MTVQLKPANEIEISRCDIGLFACIVTATSLPFLTLTADDLAPVERPATFWPAIVAEQGPLMPAAAIPAANANSTANATADTALAAQLIERMARLPVNVLSNLGRAGGTDQRRNGSTRVVETRLFSLAERREEDHVADRVLAGEHHREPVDPQPEPTGRRHAVRERLDVVRVALLGLDVAAGALRLLQREARRLLVASR